MPPWRPCTLGGRRSTRVASERPLDAAQTEFFEKNIRPVLVDKCYKCHSAESTKVKGGLLLDTREGIRAGGDTGHAVVPGSLSESLLVKALHWEDKDLRMPPEKDGGKLPAAVIANFEKWIAMGAPDPRGRRREAGEEGDRSRRRRGRLGPTRRRRPRPRRR